MLNIILLKKYSIKCYFYMESNIISFKLSIREIVCSIVDAFLFPIGLCFGFSKLVVINNQYKGKIFFKMSFPSFIYCFCIK